MSSVINKIKLYMKKETYTAEEFFIIFGIGFLIGFVLTWALS